MQKKGNMNNNKFKFFILLIILYSCNKKNATGVYFTKHNYGVIELKKDSSYYLKNASGFNTERSFGKWEIISNNLILLKSKYQDKSINYKIRCLNIENVTDSLHIFITPNINKLLKDNFSYELVMNDSIYLKKECEPTLLSVAAKKNGKLFIRFFSESIEQQRYDTLVSGIFKIPEKINTIYLEFDANVELFNYKIINEIVAIRNGRIKISPYVYKKK